MPRPDYLGCGIVLTALTFLAYFFNKELGIDQQFLWKYVAGNDVTVGLAPLAPRPTTGELADMDDYVNGDWRNQFCWRHNLANLFEMIGLGAHGAVIRVKSKTRRVRLQAGRELLTYRDYIFDVRAKVFNNLARETVRENNAMNRAIVNREVLNVIRGDATLQANPFFCAKIVEATVAACFIDTVYDELGQEIAFGPAKRPI